MDNTSSREWNNKLEEKISKDIATLRDEGNSIILLGDFNGHIRVEDGGIPGGDVVTDTNGRRVINLTNNTGLTMLNNQQNCVGKWTWMKNNSRSIIDYVLLDKKLHTKKVSMSIDDDGRTLWPSDPDHNWIEVSIEYTPQKRNTQGK